jgi:hypothetical protein
MIIGKPVIERNADIEFVLAEAPFIKIIQGNNIKMLFIEPEVRFKIFQRDKKRIEPERVTEANSMIYQYSPAPGVPGKGMIQSKTPSCLPWQSPQAALDPVYDVSRV